MATGEIEEDTPVLKLLPDEPGLIIVLGVPFEAVGEGDNAVGLKPVGTVMLEHILVVEGIQLIEPPGQHKSGVPVKTLISNFNDL